MTSHNWRWHVFPLPLAGEGRTAVTITDLAHIIPSATCGRGRREATGEGFCYKAPSPPPLSRKRERGEQRVTITDLAHIIPSATCGRGRREATGEGFCYKAPSPPPLSRKRVRGEQQSQSRTGHILFPLPLVGDLKTVGRILILGTYYSPSHLWERVARSDG
jgi:hypothetical protein